jgi:hypothetical protein
MNRSIALLALLVLLAGWPAQVRGQYIPPRTSPNPRPAVSPYLNLTRPGNVAINYFDLVRPQIQFGSAINQLETQGGNLQQSVSSLEANANIPPTGHRSQFMNYNKYFQNLGGPNPMAPRPGTGAVGTRPPGQTTGRR